MYRSSINAFRRTLSRRSVPLVLSGGLVVGYSAWHSRRDQEISVPENFESAARRVGEAFASRLSASALSGIVAASALEAGTESMPASAPASAPTPDSQSQPTAESEPQPADAKGGAFDPETGEINWDCPCLGGMAHGPCGPEFREAFSCFVYSEEEPKGIDCVEKFRGMQDCFRQHPEIYAEELADDEDGEVDPNEVEPTPSGPGGEDKGENESEPPKGMPPPRDPPTRGTGPRPPSAEGMPKPRAGPSGAKHPSPSPGPISDRPGSPPPFPAPPERDPILDPPGVPAATLPAPPEVTSTSTPPRP